MLTGYGFGAAAGTKFGGSFDGSIEANGPSNGGSNGSGNNDNANGAGSGVGGLDGYGRFGNGGATVDLSSVGTCSQKTMQRTDWDAVLAGAAAGMLAVHAIASRARDFHGRPLSGRQC